MIEKEKRLEHSRTSMRRWREKPGNRERANAWTREWRKRNPNHMKNYNYKYRYGITLAEYKAMKKSQNNSCALCGVKKHLEVDHCHITKRIRGLVCHHCNFFLGKIDKNKNLINKLREYTK